mmetsp:Transcript_50550/g.76929  ORF Transcript_50550/g.76929 Transcript_50550/m.76929 type:complete len:267 (-) Transcript_50550:295-1095(-)
MQIACVNIGATLQQVMNGFDVTPPSRFVNRLPAHFVLCIDEFGVTFYNLSKLLRPSVTSQHVYFQVDNILFSIMSRPVLHHRLIHGSTRNGRIDVQRHISLMIRNRFEMHKNIRVKLPLERIRPSVNDRMTFVQHHIPRFHRNIVRLTVVPNHLQRPRLRRILRYVDDRTRHQRRPIYVRDQNGIFRIDPHTVQRTPPKGLSRPSLQGRSRGVPHGSFQISSTPGQFRVVQADHVGGGVPMVDGHLSKFPILPGALETVGLPKLLD